MGVRESVRFLEGKWSGAVDALRSAEGIDVWEKKYDELNPLERSHVDSILESRKSRSNALELAWSPVILSLREIPNPTRSLRLKRKIFAAVRESFVVYGLTRSSMVHHLNKLAEEHLRAARTPVVSLQLDPENPRRIAVSFASGHGKPEATHLAVSATGNIQYIRERKLGTIKSVLKRALAGLLRLNLAKTFRGKVPSHLPEDESG